MTHLGRRSATAVLLAGLVACANPPAPKDGGASADDDAPVSSDLPASTPAAAVPDAVLSALRGDLANRTGVASDAIRVVRSQAMRWNDGSMGCPKPGQSYMQVIVDGYWVILEAQGREYDYRTNLRGGFTLCEQPSPTPGGRPRDAS